MLDVLGGCNQGGILNTRIGGFHDHFLAFVDDGFHAFAVFFAILDLQRRNVEVIQEQLRQTRDRFNVGEVTRTDVAQAESRVAAAQSQMLAAQSNLTTSRATYRRVIGVEPNRLAAGTPVDRLSPRTLDLAVAQGQAIYAQAATVADPDDAFAWFNLGSDLVYFERYDEAAQAYDRSREIGLPLRMFRYQFGPFWAYFHSGRIDDLLALTDYARGVTEMSEEAWLWYGWGLYRKNDYAGAREAWNKALSINNASYADAHNALQYVQ